MAGPSIVVRILGDLKQFSSSISGAGKAASGAAASAQAAFSGMLGTLNRTGVLGPFGEALSGIDEAIGRIIEHGKKIGPSLTVGGGAVAGAGLLLSNIGSGDKAASQQLEAAIEATGKSYDDYSEAVEKAVKHQEHFGDTAQQTKDALRILTQATKDPQKALDLLGTATDLAAAKHEDLSTAALQLGRTYNGNGRILKEFGINASKAGDATKAVETASKQAESADKSLASAKQHLADLETIDASKKHLTVAESIALRNAQQKVRDATATAAAAHQKLNSAQEAAKNSADAQSNTMTALSDKLKGQASAAANTFAGHLKEIKAHLEDTAATLGEKYGPAITAAGTAMTGLGAAVTLAQGIMSKFKTTRKELEATSKAVTAANEAQQLSFEGLAGAELTADAAGAPLLLTFGLIVLAAAAIVAAGYLIYRNWSTIWKGIQAAVEVVWKWIKNNWPYLFVFITGPIGLAIGWIIKHWDEVTGAFKAALKWLQDTWNTVYDFIVNPIKTAVDWVSNTVTETIPNAFKTAWNWLKDTWNTVTDAITAPFTAAWNWIKNNIHAIPDAFQTAIRWLQNTWNTVTGWVTKPIEAAVNWISNTVTQTIPDAFITVWNWLSNVWGTALGLITAPIESAVNWIGTAVTQSIPNAFIAVWNWLSTVWQTALGLITAPIKSAALWVATVAQTFWDPLWTNFQRVMKKVDNFQIRIAGIPVSGRAIVQGASGGLLNNPLIPHAARGGIITSDGLIYAHAGELISPAPQAGSTVNFTGDMHFNSDIDLELFMRKAAWAIRTQRV